MTIRARKFIQLAGRWAANSSDEFPIGAVLVRGRNLVSTGWNQGCKTHPTQFRMYPQRPGTGLHAEVHALRALRPYDVAGTDLYVCRLKPTGSYGLAMPCSKCMGVLKDYSVRRVFFSHEKDDIGLYLIR